MPTDCIPTLFAFAPAEGRKVVANFDGGTITSDAGTSDAGTSDAGTSDAGTSDAGGLLLGATDTVLGLTRRLAACFKDHRDPDRIEHRVETLLTQRITGIALGYEDLIDHDHLRFEAIMAVLAGKLAASRSDCGRQEHAQSPRTQQGARYAKIAADTAAIENLFVDLFRDAPAAPPAEIILDATDVPLHGDQEGKFFPGDYDGYCSLPLSIFCGRQLLVAKLRPANIDACAGSLQEVIRLVARIRGPKTRIILRADSGFCRDALMTWAEANSVPSLFGLARNKRLVAAIGAAGAHGRPAASRRGVSSSCCGGHARAVSGASSPRRSGRKDKANPRFVVTSLPAAEIEARRPYEETCCARGERENRIKECQLDLFADRNPAATMAANQLRLWFTSFAYVLLPACCCLRCAASAWNRRRSPRRVAAAAGCGC